MARTGHHADHWRAKLVLHYDGRGFFGWQTQSRRRTVQGELSSLLGRVCGGQPPQITAAGRTDRGVHATGQVASALIPHRFEPAELQRALNALAPPDLWIASAERVPLSFHPRFDAVSREYVYRIGVSPEGRSPFRAPFCWPLGRPLDRERLNDSTGFLPGVHDFSAFAKSGQPERGVRCRILSADWRDSPWRDGTLEFQIAADRFLHRMVRYLVSVLVDIAREARPPDDLPRLLAGEAGPRAASPAPAQGLFLTRVDYSKGKGHATSAPLRKGVSE